MAGRSGNVAVELCRKSAIVTGFSLAGGSKIESMKPFVLAAKLEPTVA
jgi:hypothetical protein